MASEIKHKKKYRVRKGRVAAAAGILTAVVAAIVGVCVFFGNKGNNYTGNDPVRENTVNPAEVTQNGEYIRIELEDCNLYVGNILRLKCSSKPEEYSKNVIWSSSDQEIVSVNGKGDIIVKAPGAAAITATCGMLSDSVIINAVNRKTEDYDPDLPVCDVSPGGEIVVIQTAAPSDNTPQPTKPPAVDPTDGNEPRTEGVAPGTVGESQGGTVSQPTAPPATEGQNDDPTDAVPEDPTDEELIDRLTSDIVAAGFTKYLDDTYVYVEDSNYLGEIIVGESFVHIYLMTRTTSFDTALKRVIMSLLPTEYENVFAQLISAETDRTFGADGLRVRIVAPTGGGHAQLIIYY